MTNPIRAHNTDADAKRRAAEKAADDGKKQHNAAPGKPKNAPERVPGQNIPVEKREQPQR
ncbi:hypothetical protein [Dyella sp. GSA-30]|uniref:hypothetical protein n=1 Tax=Dyella sp. GSA-30 TaxID=2994496 RepID=UPI002492AC9D|nr:hypothetical protein [Dyella sp. GSA-30]BDU21408.1 hypothetical protein DYGSA30_28650 [Dyella sp. GSA-30]